MFANEETRDEYRRAWEDWTKQVEHLHRVFLDGEQIRPDQLKALLTREARRKDLYDVARLRLLGLDSGTDDSPGASSENPFKS